MFHNSVTSVQRAQQSMEEEGVQETEPTPNARLKGPSAGGDPDDFAHPRHPFAGRAGGKTCPAFQRLRLSAFEVLSNIFGVLIFLRTARRRFQPQWGSIGSFVSVFLLGARKSSRHHGEPVKPTKPSIFQQGSTHFVLWRLKQKIQFSVIL